MRVGSRRGLLALMILGLGWAGSGCHTLPATKTETARGQMPGTGLPPANVISDLGPVAVAPPVSQPMIRDVVSQPMIRDVVAQPMIREAEVTYVSDALPTELDRKSLPPYTIAPPDILVIDALRLVPRPPYKIEAMETLMIQVSDTLPNQPIAGPFVIAPDGTINLGFSYGSVRVGGLTMEQAQAAIRTHLGMILRNPQVTLSLPQYRGLQQIRGEHLVRPDGTVHLGAYGTGSVYVAGMTLAQAKQAIERHLSDFLVSPQISIDVLAYNSKVYYVIFDGGGLGQQVFRLPITGNETVLDAIGQVQGLSPVSSKKHIWVARPSPVHAHCNQVLPVDWDAITQAGSTGTNYQLFPGDRVYVRADCLIATDNWLAKVLSPVERILGVTFLGANTVQTIRNPFFGSGGGVVIAP